MYIDPDQAVVSIGIVTKDEDLQTAQQLNQQQSSSVMQSLMANGVLKKDIQTSSYQVNPQYNYDNGKQVFTGYEVRQIYRVTIQNLEKVGTILDDALKNGANRIENIQFVHSNPIEAYQQALASAYQKAYQKALTLANQSNQHLNPQPASITEQSTIGMPSSMNVAYLKAADESTPVQPGQIGVTASITVEFKTQ
ncbi:hypothetical protein KH172YL63_09490 [Bacillus sp. KH172YL63]|nr:hypothetical protein KH172YL63_09490 [Bacillus sp. KH172YL63]